MPAPRGLVQQLDQELHNSGLLPRGGRLLVAVSGGADSVALLRLLEAVNGSRYWGWKLAVGHVDHGIRGASSAADGRFVRALARHLGLAFTVRKLKLPQRASEDAAREKRWQALAAMAKQTRCDGVITAHHADDQAETVLMRMMRGCGIDGLRGIPAAGVFQKIPAYRPLLNVRRAALREYLQAIGQDWREDETNASPRYTRNRIRSELLPLMESMYNGVTEALVRLSTMAGEAWSIIDDEASCVWLEAFRRTEDRGQTFDRDVLRKENPMICGEMLRIALKLEGGTTESADFERVRQAVRIVQGNHGAKQVELGGGVVLRIEGKRVVIAKERPRKRAEG